jgi:hypothetical protein
MMGDREGIGWEKEREGDREGTGKTQYCTSTQKKTTSESGLTLFGEKGGGYGGVRGIGRGYGGDMEGIWRGYGGDTRG